VTRSRCAFAVTLLLLAAACGEPFDPAWLVVDNRVLGARAEVEGDPARAWPRPGETVSVTWLVVDEDAARPLAWAFAWCPAAPTAFGEPFCVPGTSPQLLPPQLAPGPGPPVARIDVPSEAALGGADQLLLVGLVCAAGRIEATPAHLESLEGWEDVCVGDGAKATPVLLPVPVQLGDAINLRPQIAQVRIGGEAWAAPAEAVLEAATTTCPDDPAVRRVSRAEVELPVELEMTPGSREDYDLVTAAGDVVRLTEALRVQHVVTSGALPRLFTVLDEEGATTAHLTWSPPEPGDPMAERPLVRLHFVVTDGRSGTAFTSRALCLDD
jgi:hypothetical protein